MPRVQGQPSHHCVPCARAARATSRASRTACHLPASQLTFYQPAPLPPACPPPYPPTPLLWAPPSGQSAARLRILSQDVQRWGKKKKCPRRQQDDALSSSTASSHPIGSSLELSLTSSASRCCRNLLVPPSLRTLSGSPVLSGWKRVLSQLTKTYRTWPCTSLTSWALRHPPHVSPR